MQLFEYKKTEDNKKVTLVAFYQEEEANQWWQLLKKGYHVDNVAVTWIIFEKELLAWFGPTKLALANLVGLLAITQIKPTCGLMKNRPSKHF